MAKAIKQIKREIPNREEEQSQAVADIVTALADNREAIMETIGIVKQLHEIGVLKALNGLLENRIDVGEIAIQQINQPAMHNTIKNGMSAFKFLGKLEPDQLQIMLDGVSKGLEKSAGNIDKNENVSLWKLGNSFRHSEVRASLATMVGFLEGMGEVFQDNKRELH